MFGGIKVGVDLDGHRAIELHPPEIRRKLKRDSPLLSEGRPGVPADGGHRGQIVQPFPGPILVGDRELCRRSHRWSLRESYQKERYSPQEDSARIPDAHGSVLVGMFVYAPEGIRPIRIRGNGEVPLELAVELDCEPAGLRCPGYFDELFRGGAEWLELQRGFRPRFGGSRFGGRGPELPRLWVNVDVHARGSLRRRPGVIGRRRNEGDRRQPVGADAGQQEKADACDREAAQAMLPSIPECRDEAAPPGIALRQVAIESKAAIQTNPSPQAIESKQQWRPDAAMPAGRPMVAPPGRLALGFDESIA